MITFEVEGKEFSMPTSWEETTLRKSLEIGEIQEEGQKAILEGKDLDIELVSKYLYILTGAEPGELDEILIPDLNVVAEKLKFLQEPVKPFQGEHFDLNGNTYVMNKDQSTLTLGEIISIKTLMSDRRPYEYIPDIVSILVRPGKEKLNKETGKTYWKQERFTTEVLGDRKNIFMEGLTTDKVIAVTERFFSGSTK